MAKSVQRRQKSQKIDKISTKPLKVFPVYPSEEPFPAKPFFRVRTAEKDFVGKYETFRVFY